MAPWPWWVVYGMGWILVASSKCLYDYPDVRPRRQFYYSGQSLPITIEVSDRESHILSSLILKILLEEVAGYDNVTLRTPGFANTDLEGVLDRVAGCRVRRCAHSFGDVVPETMVNLEIWMPAGFNMEPWVRSGLITDAGPLGPHGRYGWFVPASTVEDNWNANKLIVDHWRAFTMDSVTKQFSLQDRRPLIKNVLTHTSQFSSLSVCRSPACHDGILHGPHCHKTKKCALMVAGFPHTDDGVLGQQVRSLGLDVSVAWIGHRLYEFVSQRTQQPIKEPVLFFSRVPSNLTAYGNYTRVKFPMCHNSSTSIRPTNCDFEVHQLSKVMWAKMQSHTPEAHHLVSSMSFTHAQYEELLRLLVRNNMNDAVRAEGVVYERTACQWVRENQRVWKKWIPSGVTKRQRIYIGGMFPITGPYWRQPGIVPGALMALEYINRNNRILPDYEIIMIVQDTQCKSDVVMKQFMHFLVNTTHPVAAILGPGCSETAEPVAGVSKHFNTVIISYSVEAVTLADRGLYPLFFRTVPGMSQNGAVYLELFKLFDWHQVALLAEDGQEFPEYHAFLQDLFLSRGIAVVYHRKMPRQATPEDASKYVEDLKQKDVKIIILTSYEMSARAVICEAAKQHMTAFEGYQWFLPTWFTPRWWDTDFFNRKNSQDMGNFLYISSVPCHTDQMLHAIQGHMSLSNAFFGHDDSHIMGNLTVAQWKDAYLDKLNDMGIKHEDFASPYATYAYDAMWVFALGLDHLLKEDPSALESLHTEQTTTRFMYHLNNTHFVGASGPVRFSGADRTGIINIQQFMHNTSRLIGQYVPDKNISERLSLNLSQVVWVTGQVPKDGRQAPRQCGVEAFRAVLGVDCDTAIVVANIMGVGLFGVVMVISLIIVKRRYDAKVRATRERMQELGLMSDTSWLCLDQWEVSREHVVLNRKLGEGAFGTVYGGEAFLEDTWVAVAVKTLKVGSNPEEKLDFLSEAEMMKRFEHENIVKLLGVCTRGEPAYTIMEFMLHGDLKTFLLARRQMVGQHTREAEDVTPEALTRMALDVTYGLKYLTDMKYVHRDLACRNCLVHASKRVKIGDFGMTRPMYDSDYYRFNKRGMLPVRWMAPESLTDGLFTPSSDIWSYGVLLFEIMTFGSFPYQGLSNKQVLEYVKNGNTISLPTLCPTELKSMLQSCWAYDPRQRPFVDDFVDLLRTNVLIIKPCIDAPLSAVAIESNEELSIPSKQPHQRLRIRTTSEHNQIVAGVAASSAAGGGATNAIVTSTAAAAAAGAAASASAASAAAAGDTRSGGSSSGGANVPSPNSTSSPADLFSLMPHHIGWAAGKTQDSLSAASAAASAAEDEMSLPVGQSVSTTRSGSVGTDDGEPGCLVMDTSCAVEEDCSSPPPPSPPPRSLPSLASSAARLGRSAGRKDERSADSRPRYTAVPLSAKEADGDVLCRCHSKDVWQVNGTSAVGRHAVGTADVVLR